MRDPETREFYSTPQALLRAFQALVDEMPDCRLVKTQVGNLAILSPAHEFRGYVDLHEAEVVWIQ